MTLTPAALRLTLMDDQRYGVAFEVSLGDAATIERLEPILHYQLRKALEDFQRAGRLSS